MNDIDGLKGEDKINYRFANLVLSSAEFRLWLLGKMKFSKLALASQPVSENEYLERYRKFWWKD